MNDTLSRHKATLSYLKGSATAAIVVVLFLALWFASDIFLMAFAGLILAVLLGGAADWISRKAHIRRGIALLLAITTLLVVVASLGWLSASHFQDEWSQLRSQVPSSWRHFVEWAQQNPVLSDVVDKFETSKFWYKQTSGHITTAFSSAASILGSVVVILFAALYFASDGDLYVRSALKLIPESAEARAKQVLSAMHSQLLRWLLGKLSLMAFVGIATAVGLLLLGVPLVLPLALLAALLDFIPNVGPIASAVPAMLIAFTIRPMLALEVGALYLGVQIVESYILGPLVQKRAVSLPPAFTLLGQVFIGTLFGPLGLILATPLLVVLMTFVKMVYVEDFLGKRAAG